MNIHIFGHSICRSSRKTSSIPTFSDIILEKFQLPETNLHQADGSSEERILYTLKKTKNVDLAIIFHGSPSHIFIPTLDRDLIINDEFWDNSYFKKIKYYQNITNDLSLEDVKEVDREDFKPAFEYFLKYFHTRDLSVNRHNGALIQIDQYLKAKEIPAIHCVLPSTIPDWFKFTSGIVDNEIVMLQFSTNQYACNYDFVINRINPEGNRIIADKLCHYVSLIGRS
jgi:hypothetical protein